MVCLQCGKEMPFYKKLTGQGEFCSADHRRRFQEEFDRRAIERLRLARPKAPPAPPAPAPSVSALAPAISRKPPVFEPVPVSFSATLSADWFDACLRGDHA